MGKAVGVDVGTMFFQTAELDDAGNTSLKTVRNAFVELARTEDIHEMLKQNKFQWVEDDRNVYVLGEDAVRFARMLPGKVELRRPLQDGVLNAGEEKKMLVLNELIRSSIGKAPDKKSVVCTCVSSPPVDGSQNNTFHERRLKGMFENQGWVCTVIEEALAVILAERPTIIEADGTEVPYSGIGVSFGAGRVNCVLAYKGITVVGMSASRSGDWIDNEVAAALSEPIASIRAHKETKFNFNNVNPDSDKDFGIEAYYTKAVDDTFEMFASKFLQVKSDFERPLDIVVAGGTSMPPGFISFLDRIVRGKKLPFEVKEVRHSKDPRNSVVKGLLTKATITAKSLEKKDSPDEILKG